MSALSFAARHDGRIVTSPGGLGGQCVDLADLYLLEEYRLPHVYLDAIDWSHATIRGWRWIANTPLNIPPQGALVVWRDSPPLGIGRYGHVALVLCADINVMVTFDQNWPVGSACRAVIHSYIGVLGWQAPL